MKTFALRLLVTLAVLYALGALAFGLLHYPPGERPDVPTIVGDYTSNLCAVFRRKPSQARAPDAATPDPSADSSSSSLDRLRGDVGLDLGLSLALSQIIVPETSAHLPAGAAATWDALRPIYAKTLPDGIDDLARLRRLKGTDRVAFERERDAARARLVPARATLLPHAEGPDAVGSAVKMLDVLDRLDARLAAL